MMQPWKLVTLAISLAILIAGAYIEQLLDWDAGVSLVMGMLTYLTNGAVRRACTDQAAMENAADRSVSRLVFERR